jgi:FMN phosphatase YigB (HAD superfamily)
MFAEMAVVFLLDVDNTLIDNDRGRVLMAEATERLLGAALSKEYWSLYEEVRKALGYVDSLETLERFHARHGDPSKGRLARAILDFDYTDIRYPETLDVLAVLRSVGTPVVLSDGDPVFQALKIARAGVADAVDDNVLVFAHKEEHLEDVALLFPADHYVAVDDKAAILARIKMHWDRRVRTVHVLQGKYADDEFDGPRPDAVIGRIAELETLLGTPDALRVFLEGASIRGPA